MELYARAGQRGAALRQYAECERVLKEELGVEPGAETSGRSMRRIRSTDLEGLPDLRGLQRRSSRQPAHLAGPLYRAAARAARDRRPAAGPGVPPADPGRARGDWQDAPGGRGGAAAGQRLLGRRLLCAPGAGRDGRGASSRPSPRRLAFPSTARQSPRSSWPPTCGGARCCWCSTTASTWQRGQGWSRAS